MRFLLCLMCRRAWLALTAASCCNAQPLDCNPWGSDGRAWYRERIKEKASAVVEAAHYRENKDHRRSLLKGIRQRGNWTVRGSGPQ